MQRQDEIGLRIFFFLQADQISRHMPGHHIGHGEFYPLMKCLPFLRRVNGFQQRRMTDETGQFAAHLLHMEETFRGGVGSVDLPATPQHQHRIGQQVKQQRRLILPPLCLAQHMLQHTTILLHREQQVIDRQQPGARAVGSRHIQR